MTFYWPPNSCIKSKHVHYECTGYNDQNARAVGHYGIVQMQHGVAAQS